jgi:hypothetical protein
VLLSTFGGSARNATGTLTKDERQHITQRKPVTGRAESQGLALCIPVLKSHQRVQHCYKDPDTPRTAWASRALAAPCPGRRPRTAWLRPQRPCCDGRGRRHVQPQPRAAHARRAEQQPEPARRQARRQDKGRVGYRAPRTGSSSSGRSRLLVSAASARTVRPKLNTSAAVPTRSGAAAMAGQRKPRVPRGCILAPLGQRHGAVGAERHRQAEVRQVAADGAAVHHRQHVARLLRRHAAPARRQRRGAARAPARRAS